MPIHFMHKSVAFEELIALYAVSDVCLVSSTRDGMNLVSYEYIATQQKRHGVMILSEFTGAAQSLNGSIVVNPRTRWIKYWLLPKKTVMTGAFLPGILGNIRI